MEISEVKVWRNGKWSVYENRKDYIEWCDSVLSSLFMKADVAMCSYIQNDQVISKAMYIVKKKDNSELWFNSDSTAELTQVIQKKRYSCIWIRSSKAKRKSQALSE